MKQCPNCGAKLPEEARFCIHCMTALEEKTFLKPMKIIGRWQRNSAIALLVCISLVIAILSAPYAYTKEEPEKGGTSEVSGTQSAEKTDIEIASSDETSDISESSGTQSTEKTDAETAPSDEASENGISEETTDAGTEIFDPDSGGYAPEEETNEDEPLDAAPDDNTDDTDFNQDTEMTSSEETEADSPSYAATDKTTSAGTGVITATKPNNNQSTTDNSTSSDGNPNDSGTNVSSETETENIVTGQDYGFIIEITPLKSVPEGYTGIYTKEDLNDVRENLAGNYILMNDIEFTDADFAKGGDFYNDGAGWDPLGSFVGKEFTGTFDGNGYTVKNLYINLSGDVSVFAGLFAHNEGTIRNLGIENSSITANSLSATAAGIAAYMSGGEISNCYNAGTVTAVTPVTVTTSSAGVHAGGIVGMSYGGTLNNCLNAGKVTTTILASSPQFFSSASTGGITAYMSAETGTINNCYNKGTVTSTSVDFQMSTGGIIGHLVKGTVNRCCNMGHVIGGDNYVYLGGIVGKMLFGTVSDCFNVGSIKYDASDWAAVGGIAGHLISSCTIKNCYNAGVFSSVPPFFVGAVIGYNDSTSGITNCFYLDSFDRGTGYGTEWCTKYTGEQMQQKSTFTGFDFRTVWIMGSGSYPYPILRSLITVQ